MYCPKCRNQVLDDNSLYCNKCGSKLERENNLIVNSNYTTKANNNGTDSNKVTFADIKYWTVLLLIIIGIIGSLVRCCGSSGDTAKVCSGCGRKFSSHSNVISITRSSLCERCHKNYEYTQDVKKGLENYK